MAATLLSTSPQREPDLLHPLEHEVGGDARRLLRPRDPQPAVVLERARERGNRRASSAWRVTKNTITSRRPRACVRSCTPSGSFPSVASNPWGAATTATRDPSLMPELPRKRRARVARRCHRRIVSPPISMIRPVPGPQVHRATGGLSTGPLESDPRAAIS